MRQNPNNASSPNILSVWWDARRAHKQGPVAIEKRQRARLATIVGYARQIPPYYREFYRDVPDQVVDPTVLPVTSKKQLMARFGRLVH